MLIYSNQRSKKRKLTTKQRELQNEWEELVNRTKTIFSTKKPSQKVNFTQKLSPKQFVRETEYYPSKDTGYYNTFKKNVNKYTGDKVMGIGTLHKSNAVPIFTDEEAKDQARMRR